MLLNLQAQQREANLLSKGYYDKWTNIHTPQLSDEGRWVAAATRTKQRDFHLYVFNTQTGEHLEYPRGTDYTFIKDTPWFTYKVDKSRYFLNLEDSYRFELKDLKEYKFLADEAYLFVQTSDGLGKLIRSRDQKVLWQHQSVVEFAEVSKGKEVLIWVRSERDRLLKLSIPELEEYIIQETDSGSIKKLTVDQDAVAWIEERENSHTIYVQWEIMDKSSRKKLDMKAKGFPPGSKFKTDYPGELVLYKDRKALVFDVHYPHIPSPYDSIYKLGVEQWNGSDPVLYPRMHGLIEDYNNARRIVWFQDENRLIPLTSASFPKTAIHPSLSFALVYNTNQYPKLGTLQGIHDIWLIDLKTGARKLLLANFPYALSANLKFDPKGNYITYYKNEDWWLYDLNTGNHENLTGDWDYSPINEYSDDGGLSPPASDPIWSRDGRYLFINDFYDLHVLDFSDKTWRKITSGRSNGLQYRVVDQLQAKNTTAKLADPYISTLIGLKGGIVLKVIDLNTLDTGFKLLNPDFSLEPIVKDSARLDFIKYDKLKQHFIYRKQSYDQPESLWVVSIGNKPVKLLQTNEELLDLYKIKAELVHYKGMNDEILKGILYYPLNYQPNQKYPLVTHIYQRVSSDYHEFYEPDLLIEEGILNPFVLQQEGYFVFYPDINYIPGRIKDSAFTCVINGLAALNNTSIDADRMALEGFSFGGYQSGLIATKMNPFKTIVAGAPPIDPMRDYFNINENLLVANYFFYESHQLRQRGSFFDYKEDFYEDSVLAHSDNITIPMLIYAGGKDGQVDWKDSLSLYLSLRRQGKPVIFLKYQGENHNLMKPTNNEDLSKRILDWFDFHLKGKDDISWIKLEYTNRGAP